MAQPELTPQAIRRARLEAGLTLAQAGAVVNSNLRTWQAWEAGSRNMPPVLWHCFTYWVQGKSAPPFSRARE